MRHGLHAAGCTLSLQARMRPAPCSARSSSLPPLSHSSHGLTCPLFPSSRSSSEYSDSDEDSEAPRRGRKPGSGRGGRGSAAANHQQSRQGQAGYGAVSAVPVWVDCSS